MQRFISEDPIGFRGGVNLYTYVEGNPLSKVDPTGEIGLIGAAVGAGLDIGEQMFIGGKSWKCVHIGSVLTSAAVGAFTPGWPALAGLARGKEKAVAEWGWLGLKDAAIWQGLGFGTGKLMQAALKKKPWTIGDDCDCK